MKQKEEEWRRRRAKRSKNPVAKTIRKRYKNSHFLYLDLEAESELG
jgi:hypothetical protein